MRAKAVCLSAVLLILISLPGAKAQDVDVPGNLTMTDSSATAGNILKNGTPFLHNFGTHNTFLGANAGNLTTMGRDNTAIGYQALSRDYWDYENTAIGAFAMQRNVSGNFNTAVGYSALMNSPYSHDNTAIGHNALRDNDIGNSNTATGTGCSVTTSTAATTPAPERLPSLVTPMALPTPPRE